MRGIFIGIAICFLTSQVAGLHAQPRQKLLFDFGWKFKLGDAPDADASLHYPEVAHLDKTWPAEVAQELRMEKTRMDPVKEHIGERLSYVGRIFNDRTWGKINLPHDWAVDLPYDPKGNVGKGMKDLDSLKGFSIGWYRKTFTLPKSDEGKIISIEFDGIYRNALVWLNGHCLGRNVSGYVGFSLNITKYITFGGQNTLVVRVDASHNEGWFYEGAGIYRHTWLVKTETVHVAHWGTFVHSRLMKKDAEVTIETEVQNDAVVPKQIKLLSSVLNNAGLKVGSASSALITIPQGQTQKVIQKVQIINPTLWDLNNRYLYKVTSRIIEKLVTKDVYVTTFGIRTIRWDKDSGFYLNGKHIFLKGTCNHQDHAGVGTAMPDRLQYYRIKKLIGMGSNAYRTSHNAPTPEMLQAADELGMMVMDESRRMSTDEEAVKQLEQMIRRDRNHPSIIIWSIGNEEEQIQGTDYGRQTAKILQEKVHDLDTTRPVTVAMNGQWGKGFSEVIDVQGFNYKRNADMDEYRKLFPDKPAVGTEEGSSHATRGVYKNDPEKGYISSYLPIMRAWSSTPEDWLKYYNDRPWVAGGFAWTGMDYRGEPAYKSWPSVGSSYGIMDICGFPKDHYYGFQSWWTIKPVLHIMPHWNWPDSIGKTITVRVYSNCQEVELYHNGKLLSRKKVVPFEHLDWPVVYQPGKISAKGYVNGKLIKEETIETTGDARALKLMPDRKLINADGEDVCMVNFAVTDTKGRVVPEADNEVTFTLTGPAKIIGVGNGDPSSHEPDKGNKRKVFKGLGQVIIQSDKSGGVIKLTATSNGLKTSVLLVKCRTVKLRPQL